MTNSLGVDYLKIAIEDSIYARIDQYFDLVADKIKSVKVSFKNERFSSFFLFVWLSMEKNFFVKNFDFLKCELSGLGQLCLIFVKLPISSF